MTDLQKTIAAIGMRIGALEGFMETLIVTFEDLLPPAYQKDLRNMVAAYQKTVDELEKEISES